VPDVEEALDGAPPEELVLVNARAKALAGRGGAPDERLVLGADTDVVIDDAMLGKPADADAAAAMLRRLSGRDHVVLGAIVVLGPFSSERSGVERTIVGFRELGEGEIDSYVRSGEWRGRAGGYAIQGLGASLVEKVEGDVSNVIGLPLPRLLALVPELFAKP
jgi:septum formation protein